MAAFSSPGSQEYAYRVGSLLANLQSLELLLRMFLCVANDEELGLPPRANEEIEETYLTNWMHLSGLIDAYNRELTADETQFSVSKKTATIRGALTHGRIFTDSPVPSPFCLYRFSKPINGKVKVESVTEITDDEVQKELTFIEQEFRKVADCAARRRYFDATKVGT